MAIQHKDIPDSELHEPKGVSTAPAGTLYVSDGLGSGSWKRVSVGEIEGLTGVTEEGLFLVTDGLGGVKAVPNIQYGTIAITSNNGEFTVTGASDNTLNTNSDYEVITGIGAPWAPNLSYGITADSDGLIVNNDGVYKLETWIDLVKYPTNASKLAVKYVINGSAFGNMKITSKSNSGGDAGNLVGFGLLTLLEGDKIQLAVASTDSGTIVLESANLTLTLVRPL